MDRWVKGSHNGVDKEPAVRVYAMGAGEWRTGDSWPLAGVERVPLYLGGQAGERAGGLFMGGQAARRAVGQSTFTSDPSNPVRDPYAESAGAHDYRGLGDRPDVLIFETDPLVEDLEVVGPITAELYVSVDQPDTDIWVKLLDVSPDGTAYNVMSPGLDVLRASYRGLKPKRDLLERNRVYKLELPNLLTANRFKAGHRVRTAIMASFMPHMSRNLHTGLLEMVSDESVTARVTLHHGGAHASRLILPVLGGPPDRRAGDGLETRRR
jgi:putative CocE/NonD family hydrolase